MNKYVMTTYKEFENEVEIVEVRRTYCFESVLCLETLSKIAKEIAITNKKLSDFAKKETFFGQCLNIVEKHDTCILESILTLDDWFEQNKIKN